MQKISFENFLKTIDHRLRNDLFLIYQIILPEDADLVFEIQKSIDGSIEDIYNLDFEYTRVIRDIFNFINASFDDHIEQSPSKIINTEYGIMDVTRMDYDDFRGKPDWIFMEFIKGREDNIDLFATGIFDFIVKSIDNRPYSGYIYYPNSDTYIDYLDKINIKFSEADWKEACVIYSSLLTIFRICIHVHLKNSNLLSEELLKELGNFYGYITE